MELVVLETDFAVLDVESRTVFAVLDVESETELVVLETGFAVLDVEFATSSVVPRQALVVWPDVLVVE